jgi:hypothetical protein
MAHFMAGNDFLVTKIIYETITFHFHNAMGNNSKNCEKYKVEKYKATEHKNMANKLVSFSSQDGSTSKGVMCCGLNIRHV